MRFRRLSTLVQIATLAVLVAGVGMLGGCSGEKDVDPTTLGFKQYYKCASDADTVTIGKRADARACLAACKTVSSSLLDGNARACWYLDGSAGVPRDCRLCKATAPVEDDFLNNWTVSLPAGGK